MATRHYHNHFRFSYPTSFRRHFTSLLIVLSLIVLIIIFSIQFAFPQKTINLNEISAGAILFATYNTVLRLTIAYLFSLAIAVPVSLFITRSEKLERIFLPIADIIQSIPVLAFFPVIVLAFIKVGFLNGAAIFILFTSMVWNIVFSMIGGVKTIPQDIKDASFIFGAKGLKKILFVTLPSVFPSIVTGSFLAWAQGWNISIVAEALHAFIPNGDKSKDLFGLGSLLVNSFAQSQNSVFIATLIAMVVVITVLNFFVWQKLLKLAERYKFD